MAANKLKNGGSINFSPARAGAPASFRPAAE
jgi:hypothetical protein